jgi:hypothetical protein
MNSKLHDSKKIIRFPNRGTKSAYDYYASWKEINRFYNFVLLLVVRADKSQETIYKMMMELIQDPIKKEQVDNQHKRNVRYTDLFKRNVSVFCEIILVRHIENFLAYHSSLLYEIFTQRPETLKSSEQIDVATVLKHESIDSLVTELAEKKVEGLSYSSFFKLSEYYKSRFKLIIADKSTSLEIAKYIQIRNISVHNRCIVNQRSIENLGVDPSKIGTKYLLKPSDIDKLRGTLLKSIKHIDAITVEKLKIKRINFNMGNLKEKGVFLDTL